MPVAGSAGVSFPNIAWVSIELISSSLASSELSRVP